MIHQARGKECNLVGEWQSRKQTCAAYYDTVIPFLAHVSGNRRINLERWANQAVRAWIEQCVSQR